VAELLAQELGKGLQAGWVAEQLVKVRGPAAHPTDVLIRPLLLMGRVFDDGFCNIKRITVRGSVTDRIN
jgi:hypothetical protein